jgi:hypothetical protein
MSSMEMSEKMGSKKEEAEKPETEAKEFLGL